MILVGCGGHAVSSIDVIEKENRFSIFGLIGSKKEIGKKILGYKVIGTDKDLPKIRKKISHALITVGQIKNNITRKKLFFHVQKMGFEMPIIISPRAYVSKHSILSPGVIVLHNSIVNSKVKIGKNCIINTNSVIEHGSRIGDHCHVSTSVTINGNVTIGSGTFVGSNSTVIQSAKIGKNCLIGMGSRIFKNIKDDSKV